MKHNINEYKQLYNIFDKMSDEGIQAPQLQLAAARLGVVISEE